MSGEARKIFCAGCNADVFARLTTGAEVYPHRGDLSGLPFWRCDGCGAFVGCHHKTKERTRPLGIIPTQELKRARQEIHKIIDPIWQKNRMRRGELYAAIASRLGVAEYHTAEIRSIEEARRVYRIARELERSAGGAVCEGGG